MDETPNRLNNIISSINGIADDTRSAMNTLLIISLYLGLLILSVDDEAILRDKTSILPQIGISIKISVSYILAPLLYVFIYAMTALKLRGLQDLVRAYKAECYNRQENDVLIYPFFYVNALLDRKLSQFTFARTMEFLAVYWIPLGLILATFLRFLAYGISWISFFHIILICLLTRIAFFIDEENDEPWYQLKEKNGEKERKRFLLERWTRALISLWLPLIAICGWFSLWPLNHTICDCIKNIRINTSYKNTSDFLLFSLCILVVGYGIGMLNRSWRAWLIGITSSVLIFSSILIGRHTLYYLDKNNYIHNAVTLNELDHKWEEFKQHFYLDVSNKLIVEKEPLPELLAEEQKKDAAEKFRICNHGCNNSTIMAKEESYYQHAINEYSEGIDLSNRILRLEMGHANMPKANFSHTILIVAYMDRANLINADFTSANLEGANLSFSNLTGANFRQARLDNATLTKTNLTGANLIGAILLTRSFPSDDLTNGVFYNSRTMHLIPSSEDSYKVIPPTEFPDTFSPIDHHMIDICDIDTEDSPADKVYNEIKKLNSITAAQQSFKLLVEKYRCEDKKAQN